MTKKNPPPKTGELITLEDGRTITMPVSKRGNNLKPWQFKPGQSGNPGGRPVGARTSLTTNFLKRLSDDFNKHGEKVISRARNSDPLGYVKVIAGLLPKQLEKVQPLEELSDAELAAGIALLRSKLSVGDGSRSIAYEAGEGEATQGDASTVN